MGDAGRDSLGRFTKGNPGRPPGSKNRKTHVLETVAQELDALIEERGEAISPAGFLLEMILDPQTKAGLRADAAKALLPYLYRRAPQELEGAFASAGNLGEARSKLAALLKRTGSSWEPAKAAVANAKLSLESAQEGLDSLLAPTAQEVARLRADLGLAALASCGWRWVRCRAGAGACGRRRPMRSGPARPRPATKPAIPRGQKKQAAWGNRVARLSREVNRRVLTHSEC